MSSPSHQAHLGRYPVRERLGAGAFATVWLAEDEHLDSLVAIKVLADNWTEDHHVRQRFVEEGRFLRRVESPHVVTVYDAGELEDGRPYLVMSYADRGTLADRLERGPVPPAEAIGIINQIGAGLAALHGRGVLHRDVKPANVLFRTRLDDGREDVIAMLGDLGLGKSLDMASRLTMVAGTPSYVSPEQARGESLDQRSDVYSLAALTYLLLAGRPPYGHADLGAAAHPPPPPLMGGGAPALVEQVIRHGLAADPEQRFADVPAFLAALNHAAGPPADSPAYLQPTLQPTAQPTRDDGDIASAREPRRPRHIGRIIAAALALVLGAGVGFGADRLLRPSRTLTDQSGSLTVTVPRSWTRVVATDAWTPPGAQDSQPALSAGTREDWDGSVNPASGVFVGLLEGDELPAKLPAHPECDARGRSAVQEVQGLQARKQVFTGCPGPDVTLERVIQEPGGITGLLAWIQIRGADRDTVVEVANSLEMSLEK